MLEDATDMICLHCMVSGKVQGVSFRRETHTLSTHLGLTGWVKNMGDKVEVMVCGPKKAVEQLHSWLLKGPPRAKVTHVETNLKPYQPYTHFEIKE